MILTLKFEFTDEASIQSMADMLVRATRGEPLTVPDRIIMHGVARAFNAATRSSTFETRPSLTKRQRDIYNFIRRFASQEGYTPSLSDISKHFGYRSLGTASEMVDKIARKGYLRKGEPHRKNNIIVEAA